jgi:type III secretion system FlhB-like substrate exporter
MAESMVRMASECGVPVVSHEACADLLFPLDLGTCVPPGMYEVVAKVFAWIQAAEEP